MSLEAATCTICGEREDDPRLIHDCYGCEGRFHLNPYSNRPGKDCGDAILRDEFGLYYYCQRCLRAMDAEVRGETTDAPALPPRAERPAPRRRYRRIDPR